MRAKCWSRPRIWCAQAVCGGPDVAWLYHHLLFDPHETRPKACGAEGLTPGPATLGDRDATLNLTLFPELATDPEHGYGPIARPEATAKAAALLV